MAKEQKIAKKYEDPISKYRFHENNPYANSVNRIELAKQLIKVYLKTISIFIL